MSATATAVVHVVDEAELSRKMRLMPVGGSVRLYDSGIVVKRVGGGRAFALIIPPKVTETLEVDMGALKSLTQAPAEVVKVHEQVMKQVKENDAGPRTSYRPI
jgi:hypothetical protein